MQGKWLTQRRRELPAISARSKYLTMPAASGTVASSQQQVELRDAQGLVVVMTHVVGKRAIGTLHALVDLREGF